MNFISPYIELPKKLTVKQNLEVYGRLYDVKKLKLQIDYLCEKLRLNEFINKITGELSSPGMMLLFDQSGKLTVAEEVSDQQMFRTYTYAEERGL